MRPGQLVLSFEYQYNPQFSLGLQDTLTESLWDTVKDTSLHIILQEPALLELALRKDPGVISFCDYLLNSENQESWFTALKVLETLNTYDAAQRLLVLCGSSNTSDKKIVLNVLARILSSPQREGFRRLIRSFIKPGEIDVSCWTPTALHVLESVCAEKGIEIINSDGSPADLESFLLATQNKEAAQSE